MVSIILHRLAKEMFLAVQPRERVELVAVPEAEEWQEEGGKVGVVVKEGALAHPQGQDTVSENGDLTVEDIGVYGVVACWVCVHLCVMRVFFSTPDLRPGRAAEDKGIHAVVPGLFPIAEVDIGLGIEKSDILDPTHDPLHLVGSDGSPDPRFQLVGIEVEAEVRIVGVSCSTAGNQSLAQGVLQVHLQDQNHVLGLHLLLRSGTEEAPQPHQMTNTHHLNRKVKKQRKNQLHYQLSRIKIRLVTWYGVEFIVYSTHCLLQRCF